MNKDRNYSASFDLKFPDHPQQSQSQKILTYNSAIVDQVRQEFILYQTFQRLPHSLASSEESKYNPVSINTDQNSFRRLKTIKTNQTKGDTCLGCECEQVNQMVSENIQLNLKEQDHQIIQINPHEIQQPIGDQDMLMICDICCQESQTEFIGLECNHKFCKQCVGQYLSFCIIRRQVQNIKCLKDGCPLIFPYHLVEGNVGHYYFSRYKLFLRFQQIESDPLKKWCPRPGCEQYVEGNPETKHVKCQCGMDVCFRCGNQWHFQFTCAQALNQGFKDAIKKFDIKFCPRCSVPIQKYFGCDHIKCFQCQYEFCWLCQMKFVSNFHGSILSFRGCAYPDGFKFLEYLPPYQAFIITFLVRIFIYIALLIPVFCISVISWAFIQSFYGPIDYIDRQLRWFKYQHYLTLCEALVILFFLIFLFPLLYTLYYLPKVFIGEIKEKCKKVSCG